MDFYVKDGTLKLDDFAAAMETHPRLVAFGYASNALGTINPVKKLTHDANEHRRLIDWIVEQQAWLKACTMLDAAAYRGIKTFP